MNWYKFEKFAAVSSVLLKKILKLYSEKMNISNISRETGIERPRILQILRDNKVYRPLRRKNAPRPVTPGMLSKVEGGRDKQIIDMYTNRMMGINQIAFEIGLDTGTITSILHHNGVKLRSNYRANKTPKTRPIYQELPSDVTNFIDTNYQKMNPMSLAIYLAAPIGRVVKYMIEKKLPFPAGYLRYVPKSYAELWTPPSGGNAQQPPQPTPVAPTPVKPVKQPIKNKIHQQFPPPQQPVYPQA